MSDANARLEKIRALIATAESFTRGGNHEAAASYQAKAQELMTKWSIEEAQLAGLRDAGSIEIGVTYLWEPFSPYQEPKIQLIDAIARHNGCKTPETKGCWREDPNSTAPTYYLRLVRNAKGQPIKHTKIHLIGRPRDREFVEMLYTSLLLQAQIEFESKAVQEQMAAQTSHPGHRIRWRNSFIQGYVSGVDARLREAKRTVVNSTPGAALVLADASKLVDGWIKGEYGKLGKGRLPQSGGGFGAARMAGTAAGLRADIGQARVGNSRKAIR